MSEWTSKEVRLKSRPSGLPQEADFEVAAVALAQPDDGEVVVRNLWMSVDPYMRGRMTERKSYIPPFQVGKPLEGGAVGQIVESKSPDLAVGQFVISMFGWREMAVGKAGAFQKIDPSLGPIEAYLGVLGMPGLTAYTGLVRIAQLKDGDAVFVSAAAGAVGSVACQIAKARGCYVVGSAGSDENCRWLTDAAGVDQAINYKTSGNLDRAVGDAFPKGIDVYFDNVGCTHLEAALNHMNPFGRIALCGMIEQYNNTAPGPAPSNLAQAVVKSLRLQGFIVSNHYDLLPQYLSEVAPSVKAGKLKWQVTVEEGIENAPRAMLRLFVGNKAGKMLVRL
ncbi:MAG TPA: NADP-dependent oxidoreductase [Candidatus Acidoferrales bacterium]|jgi:NADPH-dependent curcumin reductase CurA|nr:NADP-dependent oxidoreductase [Candidatus Acidoferrales bacterium]